MMNKYVLRKIEEAKNSGATALDLSRKGLTFLPTELGRLTHLTELNLSDNQLSELPSAICNLANLEEVHLWNNKLTTLPPKIYHLRNLRKLNLSGNKFNPLLPGISQLQNLTYLNLSWNQLSELPSAICQLPRLEALDLWGNKLTNLPTEIPQLTHLTWLNTGKNQLYCLPPEILRLKNLTHLNLSSNQLASLPLELFQLINLTELDLGSNQLTTLPPEISQLSNLTELNLWNNKLKTLPSELFQLSNLRKLYLGGNKLTRLSPKICQLHKLELLWLYGNQLTTLPPEICQLTQLNILRLGGNQLVHPPLEVAKEGIEAIRQYLHEFRQGKQRLNEVKIILVGEGDAGKTSLVRRLLGQPFDEREDTTHGINIRGWEQDVDGRKIKINIWDFGGQEIQHATHQFFLSKRSLYILVLDSRKDERAEYWLRHIEAFGGDSPVLIVLNKQDKNASFDVNRPFLREKYPGIRDFFRISCKTDYGVDTFKKSLIEELAQVPMIDTFCPTSWFRVKERLEQMDRPYISAEEYEVYCAEVGITEEQSRETLVNFLHDLGVAVHFSDFDLKAMHVLDPGWVTAAVYKIITAKEMADSNGSLNLEHLGVILLHGNEAKHSFPEKTYPFIMHLMQKFELCYELDKDSVLIPQFLPVNDPLLDFDYGVSLQFAFLYKDFLPLSILPRFMVKLQNDIMDKQHWRTGVLLKDKWSGAQALVKADVEARRINLWVHGKNPREYLHYLRYILADINSSFEKLTVSERVPMPDEPDRTADYETLRKCAERGIDRYMPDGSDKDYNVHELLGLVQPKDKDEIAGFVQKVDSQDNGSWLELLNEIAEPKWTLPVLGITFNLKGFFEKLLERQKQKRKQAALTSQ